MIFRGTKWLFRGSLQSFSEKHVQWLLLAKDWPPQLPNAFNCWQELCDNSFFLECRLSAHCYQWRSHCSGIFCSTALWNCSVSWNLAKLHAYNSQLFFTLHYRNWQSSQKFWNLTTTSASIHKIYQQKLMIALFCWWTYSVWCEVNDGLQEIKKEGNELSENWKGSKLILSIILSMDLN